MTAPVIHVVAGVLCRSDGCVLLAQRRAGSHLGGMWEFPGGKCERGESPQAALRRELREELGISAQTFTPLLSIPWAYDDKSIRLDASTVDVWQGEPVGCEGQALRWQRPEQVDPAELTPADRPLLQALRLPSRYLITPSRLDMSALPGLFDAALARGERLFQLRLPGRSVTQVRELASVLAPACRAVGAALLINHDVALARELGLGLHLRAAQLAEYSSRPLPTSQWLAVSCHDAFELERAQALGADFATLSPVMPTTSHAGAATLGWQRFAECVATAALPVYALGGLGRDDVQRAQQAGAQGVAGIGRLWW